MAKTLYEEIRPPARKAVDARISFRLDSVLEGTPPRKVEPPARRVKSASRPLSTDDLRQLKEKRDTPEGTRDRNGNPMKFTRLPARMGLQPGGDLESDWSAPGGIRNVLCLCA
jgi:hypothetical protein